MKIKLLFFGVLTDAAGGAEFELDNMTDINSVKTYIQDHFQKVLDYSHIISLNHSIITSNKEYKLSERF